MYFWKIEKLKEDIRNNSLTESERFKYAIVTFTVLAMSTEARLDSENLNVWDDISSISNILIVVIGTIFAYRANFASKGSDFLGKYFSIWFVVSIRFLVYLLPVISGVLIYQFYTFGLEEDVQLTAVTTIPFILWNAIFYWRVCFHMKQVNSGGFVSSE